MAFRLLIVEDNPADVLLLRESFKAAGVDCDINVVADGQDAIDFLNRRGAYSKLSLPTPNLVLLDINLPRVSAHEVLGEIKSNPALKTIPVVILSSSASQSDIQMAYEGHANGYVQKPRDLDEFYRIGRAIEAYWMRAVTLPIP